MISKADGSHFWNSIERIFSLGLRTAKSSRPTFKGASDVSNQTHRCGLPLTLADQAGIAGNEESSEPPAEDLKGPANCDKPLFERLRCGQVTALP
jgi:hypothetical protein